MSNRVDRAASAPRSGAAAITGELARRLRDDNNRRDLLFRYILRAVTVALFCVIGLVTSLGLGWLHLETPVVVAFIAGLALQSFILIGFLARGLFADAKQPAPEVE